MQQETKDTIYMILDLLDSLTRTSKNSPEFLKIDEAKLKDVRKELLELLNQPYGKSSFLCIDKKTELIGSLPSILANRNKFSRNEDIVKLAQRSLNYEVPSWKTRSRDAIIGMIIDEISKRKEDELNRFFEAWNKFLTEDSAKDKDNIKEITATKKDFVDIWLDFFDHYQGGRR